MSYVYNKTLLSRIYKLNERRKAITTEKYQWNGLVKKLTSDSFARLLAHGDTGVVSLYFLFKENENSDKDFLQKIYACSKNDYSKKVAAKKVSVKNDYPKKVSAKNHSLKKNDSPFKNDIEKLRKYCANDCKENDEFISKQLRKEILKKLQIAKKIDENLPSIDLGSAELNSTDGKSLNRKLKKSKGKNAKVVVTDKTFLFEMISETLNIDMESFRKVNSSLLK